MILTREYIERLRNRTPEEVEESRKAWEEKIHSDQMWAAMRHALLKQIEAENSQGVHHEDTNC